MRLCPDVRKAYGLPLNRKEQLGLSPMRNLELLRKARGLPHIKRRSREFA